MHYPKREHTQSHNNATDNVRNMSSSGGGGGGHNGYGDTYEPQQYGMRNIAGRDGYAVSGSDGYDYNDKNYERRRDSSVGAADNYYRRTTTRGGSWGDPGEHHRERPYEGDRRARGRRPSQYSNDYDSPYSSDDNGEYAIERSSDRRGRARSHSHSVEKQQNKQKRGRSLSTVGRRLSSYFGPDEHHDGEGNTEGRKWGATLAGALAGGLVGKTAKKDHWVPAALGALIGGFTAREAEKTYYRRREVRETGKLEKGHGSMHGMGE